MRLVGERGVLAAFRDEHHPVEEEDVARGLGAVHPERALGHQLAVRGQVLALKVRGGHGATVAGGIGCVGEGPGVGEKRRGGWVEGPTAKFGENCGVLKPQLKEQRCFVL